jgi:hypothetical protein
MKGLAYLFMFTFCSLLGYLMVQDAKKKIAAFVDRVDVRVVQDDFADVKIPVDKVAEAIGDSVAQRIHGIGR